MRIARETLDIYAPARQPPRHEQGQERARGARRSSTSSPRPTRRSRARVEERRSRPTGFIEKIKADGRGEAARRRASRPRSTAASSASTASTRSSRRQRIDLDQVYDFVALRIVAESVPDCYAALGIIHHTLVAGAGPHQGLHRDAAAQRLPVAAHLGHRRARAIPSRCRSAPSEMHRRGRGRHRRALEVQGRAHRRRQGRPGLPLAAPAPRVAAGGARPAGVPEP